jgi:hypothetical protein
MDFWMGQLEFFFINSYYTRRKNVFWYFTYMLKDIETLDEALKIWKKYRGNQCKLVVISKFWSRSWINRDFGSMAN